MKARMAATLLSLLGVFVAAYLYLYKLGVIGTLSCGTGGCETVQLSQWSRFFGVDVALIGVVGYAGLLLVGLASLQPRLARGSALPGLMALLSGVGLLFACYLTYLELFVIHAICRWCVGSAVIIASIHGLALFDWRHARRRPVDA